MLGLGFPELLIIGPYFIAPAIVFVLVVVLLVYGIKALRRYLRSTDGGERAQEVRKNARRNAAGAARGLQDDAGIRGGIAGRQPPGGVQMGD